MRDAGFKHILGETGEEELRRVGPDAQPDGPDLLLERDALTAEEEAAYERLSAFHAAQLEALD